MIRGSATAPGTAARHARAAGRVAGDFYTRTSGGLTVSSIGVGTYLGEPTDAGDREYEAALRHALASGINVVDTAIKYRRTRSERLVGRVVADLVQQGAIAREEIVVTTKGGILADSPDGTPPPREHDITPAFLRGELRRSLEHLGFERVDCYFVHNPEVSLGRLTAAERDRLLLAVFDMLEGEAAEGRIEAYGLASWGGFRAPLGSPEHLDLDHVWQLACRVAPTPRFRYIEVPLSLGMPATAADRNHRGATATVLDVACDLGLDVFTSGSVYGGRLVELVNLMTIARAAGRRAAAAALDATPAVSLPRAATSLLQLFELLWTVRERDLDVVAALDRLSSLDEAGLYPKALDAVRSHPGVTTALVSGERLRYVEEHCRLASVPKCAAAAVREFWSALAAPNAVVAAAGQR